MTLTLLCRKVYSENTTYTFDDWWLWCQQGWTDEQRQASFNRILDSKVLRFHCMDPNYLAACGFRSLWAEESDQAFAVLRLATMARARTRRKTDEMTEKEHRQCKMEERLPRSRASKQPDFDEDGALVYELTGSVTRQQCATVPQQGRGVDDISGYDADRDAEEEKEEADQKTTSSFAGIVHGYPILMDVCCWESKQTEHAAEFVLCVGWRGSRLTGLKGHGAFINMAVDVKILPDPEESGYSSICHKHPPVRDDSFWGANLYDSASWDEVVAEGSPYFNSEGVLELSLRVKIWE